LLARQTLISEMHKDNTYACTYTQEREHLYPRKEEAKEQESLPEQACEQSESDETLQILHRMPCTRH
jgi:hypothetical protein